MNFPPAELDAIEDNSEERTIHGIYEVIHVNVMKTVPAPTATNQTPSDYTVTIEDTPETP